jgi:hypothetical protein
MKLVTRQSLANEAPARWAQQYQGTKQADKQAKTEALARLKLPIHPSLIDEIIGNTSWTTPHYCNECDGQFDYIVQVGQGSTYESQAAYLCVPCIEKTLAMARNKIV